MNQQGDDKELKAAFAEFKELLKRESEPVGASLAPEIRLEPRIVAEPARPRAQEPASGPISPGTGESFAPLRPRASQTSPSGRLVDAGTRDAALDAPVPVSDAEQTRRGRLIYLSLAIVLAGLAGLGVALVKSPGAGTEPAIADIAPPEDRAAEQAALEPPAIGEEQQAAPAKADDLAPAQKAEAAPAPDAAPAPKAAAADQAVPLPGVPPAKDPEPAAAAKADAAQKQAAAPVAATAPVAPLASGFTQPAARTSTAALQPATRAVEPEAPAAAEPAKTETRTAIKPADRPAKSAKTKTKPAAPQTAAKPKPAAPAAVAERAEPAPAPAPAAPPPAAPAPSDNGGAFGFVKRTVNSVGSTIGDIGRSVIP